MDPYLTRTEIYLRIVLVISAAYAEGVHTVGDYLEPALHVNSNIAVAVIAPIVALDVVWDIADILNALMAIPNLIAVLLLSPVIVKETKKYLDNLDAKDDTEIPVIKK